MQIKNTDLSFLYINSIMKKISWERSLKKVIYLGHLNNYKIKKNSSMEDNTRTLFVSFPFP